MLSTTQKEQTSLQSIIPQSLESKGKNYNSLVRMILLGKLTGIEKLNLIRHKPTGINLYSWQEMLTLQSFVIVQRNLAEYQRETNLPATSAQTDKQAWLQSANGHEKRAKSAFPPQIEGSAPPYR